MSNNGSLLRRSVQHFVINGTRSNVSILITGAAVEEAANQLGGAVE
jgi:hypothetical protein